MSAYPLVHSHLLVKRLLNLNKPKSLAPALHCESSHHAERTKALWS